MKPPHTKMLSHFRENAAVFKDRIPCPSQNTSSAATYDVFPSSFIIFRTSAPQEKRRMILDIFHLQPCEGCLVVITGHGPQAEVAQVFGHELLVELGGGRLEGLEEEQRNGEEKETGEENNHHTTHR